MLCFHARLFVDALCSPAGKGLTSWLSFVMSNCDVVTFPLISWVSCGAGLYRFLIFALFLILIVKYNIGLKPYLQQGISEPIFYGDLVYKFKRIIGKPYFSDQFKKIIKRYIKVGYNLDVMRQSACLVLNPITVYSYGFLFSRTTVGRG